MRALILVGIRPSGLTTIPNKWAAVSMHVYGGAVNLAARIAAASAPREVLVADTVRALARTSASVTFVDRGEHMLKGESEPQRLFVVCARAQRTQIGSVERALSGALSAGSDPRQSRPAAATRCRRSRWSSSSTGHCRSRLLGRAAGGVDRLVHLPGDRETRDSGRLAQARVSCLLQTHLPQAGEEINARELYLLLEGIEVVRQRVRYERPHIATR